MKTIDLTNFSKRNYLSVMSKFGECIRNISKTGKSIRSMAFKQEILPTFLSTMEVGRKAVPIDYPKTIKDLHESIVETDKHLTVELKNESSSKRIINDICI